MISVLLEVSSTSSESNIHDSLLSFLLIFMFTLVNFLFIYFLRLFYLSGWRKPDVRILNVSDSSFSILNYFIHRIFTSFIFQPWNDMNVVFYSNLLHAYSFKPCSLKNYSKTKNVHLLHIAQTCGKCVHFTSTKVAHHNNIIRYAAKQLHFLV